MIPVRQQIRHDPDNGLYGDCHRAAIASLLDMPIEDVPHFCDESIYNNPAEKLSERERKWFLTRGLVSINVLFPGETDLDEVLSTMNHVNPGVLFLLGGTSLSKCGHTVVAGNGRVVHDPSLRSDLCPRHGSIVGPMEDGYWWLTFIGAAVTHVPEPVQ